MSLCSWNDLLNEVMVDLPGCQTPVAVNAIKNAVEWLCKEAHVLVQDCAPIDVAHGVSTYTFVAPSNDVLIVQMDQLRIAAYDSPLDPIRREDADVQFPQWQTATGIVRYWLGTGPRTVQLINIPDADNFDIILRVIILVTFFAAAYIAEVIRGGLAALPRGQYEAADALGLNYWQAQRLIIMTQALKVSIPGIVSSFIGLFKDTTLVAFVGLMDPLKGITGVVRADIDLLRPSIGSPTSLPARCSSSSVSACRATPCGWSAG